MVEGRMKARTVLDKAEMDSAGPKARRLVASWFVPVGAALRPLAQIVNIIIFPAAKLPDLNILPTFMILQPATSAGYPMELFLK